MDVTKQTSDARRGYLPIFRELMALYPSLTKNMPRWREGYAKAGFLAHGWYMRCHRNSEAVFALWDRGLADEAAPLRRSIIEHVLALRWVAAEGDKVLDTIARGHAKDVGDRANAVEAAAWTSVDPEELRRIVANVDPESRDRSGDYLLHYASRLSKYGDQYSQPGYLVETAKSHPTYESAVAYVRMEDGTLLWQAREPVWPVPFLTTHLLEALLCVQEMFDPKPWHGALEDILKRYLSVTDDVRRQDGLRPIDWSTGKIKDA